MLLLFFLLFFAGSCIAPPYRQFLLMQHVPIVLAALLLAYLSNRFVIGRWSFSSIIVFLCLHTLGARYLYLYVPYDVWSEKLLGVTVSEVFGFQARPSCTSVAPGMGAIAFYVSKKAQLYSGFSGF